MPGTQDSEFSYRIVRSRRTTADIVIERDGRVLARVPEAIPDQRIEDLVEAKRYWIYKNLAQWCDLNATRVLHELCHFHHLDHSEAFWNEVDKVLPAYGERKEWLRLHGAGLDV